VKLNGIDYGRAWCASGATGFFGDGYPFHRWLGPLAPDFRGSTFVAKTTTLEPRAGNMPLGVDLMPTEARPACIKINFRKAAVLNAVGLSGPGLLNLLASGRWQTRIDPFVISFMAVDADREKRRESAFWFANCLAEERFRCPFALQINFSCPNAGLDPSGLTSEIGATLRSIAGQLPDVPLMPKLNLLVLPGVAVEIGTHRNCAAICASNTLLYGSLPDRIDWAGLFGDASPLAHLGGGGLSGAPLTPLVREWVAEFRRIAPDVPLVAGGGVMRPADATALLDLGADAVEVGSVAIVRPWRVGGIIKAIHEWESRNGN
jgi:dihydroorotate dehydrogenase (NAD+) catalytic subunit